jgi:hypothetical protein
MGQKRVMYLSFMYFFSALTYLWCPSDNFLRFDAAAESRGRVTQEAYPLLPKTGEKCWINGDHYLIYEFDKKPQMGMIILKIQVFTKNGKQDSAFEIAGDSGMPSMKGAHDTGLQPFKLNKKGDYLLPVNVVMPGEWEIRINVVKEKENLYSGSIRFRV